VRERGIAAYKVPDLVEFVDAFPRTGVGKVSKKHLRAAAPTSTPVPEQH
jgi:2,3-dihydroxybenzoate-AMP ligase